MTGEPCAWIVPTYKNARPVWRFAEQHCRPLHKRTLEIHIADRVIEWRNGGFLAIYSADNDTSIRGERFSRVRVDEAARIKEETYVDVIEPTVADLNGEIWNISTPKGRNWFWRYCMNAQAMMEQAQVRGIDSYEAFWRATSDENPNPNIRNAYRLARTRLPWRSFAQEWDAEFVQDGGGVLVNISALSTARRQERRIPGHMYVVGVDWGQQEDFVCFSVIDATLREQCYLERFNGVSYGMAIAKLQDVLNRFHPIITVPEKNSMGAPLCEVVARMPNVGNCLPFTTTNISKGFMTETLALAFQQRQLQILKDTTQALELESIESKRTPSGLITYSAPEGQHDDTYIALGLAWQVVAEAYGYAMPEIMTGLERQYSVNAVRAMMAS